MSEESDLARKITAESFDIAIDDLRLAKEAMQNEDELACLAWTKRLLSLCDVMQAYLPKVGWIMLNAIPESEREDRYHFLAQAQERYLDIVRKRDDETSAPLEDLTREVEEFEERRRG